MPGWHSTGANAATVFRSPCWGSWPCGREFRRPCGGPCWMLIPPLKNRRPNGECRLGVTNLASGGRAAPIALSAHLLDPLTRPSPEPPTPPSMCPTVALWGDRRGAPGRRGGWPAGGRTDLHDTPAPDAKTAAEQASHAVNTSPLWSLIVPPPRVAQNGVLDDAASIALARPTSRANPKVPSRLACIRSTFPEPCPGCREGRQRGQASLAQAHGFLANPTGGGHKPARWPRPAPRSDPRSRNV